MGNVRRHVVDIFENVVPGRVKASTMDVSNRDEAPEHEDATYVDMFLKII